MYVRSLYLAALFALLTLAGCDTLGTNEGGAANGPRTVIVANQGNFGDGNGSISLYDTESGLANAGAITGLATIIQSASLLDGRLYVMSNTGGRVDVFDADDLEQVAQIPDVVSPRYMVVDGSTGYVTSLYGPDGSFSGGLVTVVNLASNEKVTEIPVGSNPEGLALVDDRLYVANHGFGAGSTLSVIDTQAGAVVDTIDVECDGPRFLAADEEGEIFVFCTGRTLYDDQFNPVGETNGAVRVVDGATGEIVKRIPIDGRIGTVGPGQDAYYDPEAEIAIAVQDEHTLLQFDTDRNALLNVIGPFPGQPISAVAYAGETGRFYLGRSNGFTQAGEVSIHQSNGVELSRFAAGIVPAYILLAWAP